MCFITFKIEELDLCVETFEQNELNNENRQDLIKLYCERAKKFRFSRDSEITSKFILRWKSLITMTKINIYQYVVNYFI